MICKHTYPFLLTCHMKGINIFLKGVAIIHVFFYSDAHELNVIIKEAPSPVTQPVTSCEVTYQAICYSPVV